MARAEAGTLRPAVEVAGMARPAAEATVTARVSGRVAALLVDTGERVRRGQALARLDGAPDTLAAVAGAEDDLAARQRDLAAASRQSDEAARQTKRARQEFARRRTEANNLQSLFEQGAVARQQADHAAEAAEAAEHALDATERRERNAALILRAAQARLAAQQAVVRGRQTDAGRAVVLRAPMDGRVVECAAAPGDAVQKGAIVVRVADPSRLEIALPRRAGVAPLRPGDAVPVVFEAADGPLTVRGAVARTGQAGVQIAVEDSDGDRRIAPGLAARVLLPRAPGGSVTVPASALEVASVQRRGGGTETAADSVLPPKKGAGDAAAAATIVFVLNAEGVVEARPVRVAAKAKGRAEVTGLKPGDRVVAESERPLAPGDAVRAK